MLLCWRKRWSHSQGCVEKAQEGRVASGRGGGIGQGGWQQTGRVVCGQGGWHRAGRVALGREDGIRQGRWHWVGRVALGREGGVWAGRVALGREGGIGQEGWYAGSLSRQQTQVHTPQGTSASPG